MKNMVKGFGLIAFAVIIGLGLMVCKEDSPSEDSNGNNSDYTVNKITITGIPAKFNDCDAGIQCVNNPDEYLFIWGYGEVKNRTVTFELINEGNDAEWKGTGLFDLLLYIMDPAKEDYTYYAYTNGRALPPTPDLLPQYNIKDPVTTIGFDKFMILPNDWQDWYFE